MDTYNIPPQIWLVAFQLGLNAVGWCLAVRWLPEERRAIGQWAMFMACLSLGLVLTGLRVTTADRPWLLYNGVTVVSLIGFGLMRRGTEHFVRSGCRDRTQAWLVLPPLLATLIIPPTLAWAPLRTCYAFAVQAVIMLSMARSIAPPMRREFGVAATRGLVLPLTVIGLLQGALAVRQALTWASPQEIHLDTGYNQGVLYLYLAGSAVFGFGFMYLVALRLTHQLRLASERDALTGLLNRRAMADRLQGAWRRHRRHGTPLALLMIDLDHFKAVNDSEGHAAGDVLLTRTAQLLAGQLRGEDLIARMGGEEFLVALPDTDETAALQLAERLRAAVQQELPITLSAGLVLVETHDATPEAAQQRADAALYRAKAQGRNRIELG